MMYAGIDYHKHYSFVSSLDAEGQLLLERRIHHKEPGLFRELFRVYLGTACGFSLISALVGDRLPSWHDWHAWRYLDTDTT